jgi:hypothetical protein
VSICKGDSFCYSEQEANSTLTCPLCTRHICFFCINSERTLVNSFPQKMEAVRYSEASGYLTIKRCRNRKRLSFKNVKYFQAGWSYGCSVVNIFLQYHVGGPVWSSERSLVTVCTIRCRWCVCGSCNDGLSVRDCVALGMQKLAYWNECRERPWPSLRDTFAHIRGGNEQISTVNRNYIHRAIWNISYRMTAPNCVKLCVCLFFIFGI